jgi:hypothetical protein
MKPALEIISEALDGERHHERNSIFIQIAQRLAFIEVDLSATAPEYHGAVTEGFNQARRKATEQMTILSGLFGIDTQPSASPQAGFVSSPKR